MKRVKLFLVITGLFFAINFCYPQVVTTDNGKAEYIGLKNGALR